MPSRKHYTYEELEKLAFRDSLTGLRNRTWLQENIHELKYKNVFFLDIDNLKEFNTFSHRHGDDRLIKCAESVKVHKGDIFLRFGGDEFLFFSNDRDPRVSCRGFTVGQAKIKKDILEAIHIANRDMINNKQYKEV